VVSQELYPRLHEGWVRRPSGERVFWLPPAYQRKRIDRSLIAISTDPDDHHVEFDLSKLKVGTDWVDIIASPTTVALPTRNHDI
ncbi:hypothetical protein FRC10_007610, partial [Ceratobasidium sp. 414]